MDIWIYDDKDACCDFMRNRPVGASRSLARTPFCNKHMSATDVRCDFIQNQLDTARHTRRAKWILKRPTAARPHQKPRISQETEY